jgi:signal transduction histidine kinase
MSKPSGGAVPRRRIEGTFAVSFAALVVAALALLVAVDAHAEHGAGVAQRLLIAVLLALLVILIVGVVDLQLAAARRRAQVRDARLRDAVARMEGVHGFAHTLAVALGEVRDLLGARDAMLATHELETGRAFLWGLPGGREKGERAAFGDLDAEMRDEFLFAAAADAWRAEPRAEGGWDVLGLGKEGLRFKGGEAVPAAALERLSRRVRTGRLAAVEVLRGEWQGRVLVLDPGSGPRPEESLRLAQRFVHEMAGAMQARFQLGRLRARVGAMERGRIARDLHDSTIQSLVAVEMELELLRRHAEARGSPTVEPLARVKGLLHQEILDLRDTMQRLKPSEIEPRELVGFLDATVARFGRETGIHAIFDCDTQDVELPPRVCREVARIVQEALRNVRKHSQAQNVLVRFERAPSGFRLVVDDDGQGFAAFSGRLTHAELEDGRKGPYVIKERVGALGGELTITSAGGGSRLDILLPEEAS